MEKIYRLDRYGLDKPFSRILDEFEFNNLIDAKSSIIDIISVESEFLTVLIAYDDFESFSFKNAFSSTIFGHGNYDKSQRARLEASFRASNLMNSVTAYRDRINAIRKRSKIIQIGAESPMRDLRHNSLAFDFLCYFRDFAQHYDAPVQFSSWSSGWNPEFTEHEVTWGWSVAVRDVTNFKREISSDKADKFESKFGKKCNISLMFREALSDFANFHDHLRKSTQEQFDKARYILMQALASLPSMESGLADAQLVCFVGEQTNSSSDIFEDMINHAGNLRRTPLPINLHLRHFSTRVKEGKKTPNL